MSYTESIVIENLDVFYGDHQALYDINVNIPKNKLTAIIGPSGCGKSTLLKCCNRLIDFVDGARTSGKIIVNGINVLDNNVEVTDIRHKMGLLPQKPNPLPMSIYDNIAYGPRIHGTHGKNKLDDIVEKYLKIAGLWEEVKNRLKYPANKLSIGQQQRLCLARGLAVEPEILLCDEPTSALDPISSQYIEQQLFNIKGRYTIVLVTHNIHQAMKLADYIIHIYLGKIIEHGSADNVFKNPKEERTRAYINGTYLDDLVDTEVNLQDICDRLSLYMKNLRRLKL